MTYQQAREITDLAHTGIFDSVFKANMHLYANWMQLKVDIYDGMKIYCGEQVTTSRPDSPVRIRVINAVMQALEEYEASL